MNTRLSALIFAILISATSFGGDQSGDAVKPVLRIAFFTPSDAEPPDGVRERVHLSEAAAAMLWKHPLLSGTVNERDRIPKAQLAQFRASYAKEDDRLIITGKLESD